MDMFIYMFRSHFKCLSANFKLFACGRKYVSFPLFIVDPQDFVNLNVTDFSYKTHSQKNQVHHDENTGSHCWFAQGHAISQEEQIQKHGDT